MIGGARRGIRTQYKILVFWARCPVFGAGGNTIFRTREGIERFLVTDINRPAASAVAETEVPIMYDMLVLSSVESLSGGIVSFNHMPGGCNVLYMDGHVEFLRYPGAHDAYGPPSGQMPRKEPGTFPVTKSVAQELTAAFGGSYGYE